jgi:hypothetical protein
MDAFTAPSFHEGSGSVLDRGAGSPARAAFAIEPVARIAEHAVFRRNRPIADFTLSVSSIKFSLALASAAAAPLERRHHLGRCSRSSA